MRFLLSIAQPAQVLISAPLSDSAQLPSVHNQYGWVCDGNLKVRSDETRATGVSSCEAANVPVIWETQVLESLAKEGVASRSEITDAAAGVRAECVMLNKGPYIVKAVCALDDILRRMEGHHQKGRSTLRKLRLAELFNPPQAADIAARASPAG